MAGDLVLIDIPVLVEGYHADHSRTYLLDPKNSKQREWEKALKQLFAQATEVIRPGKSWGECFRQMAALARNLGVEDSFQMMLKRTSSLSSLASGKKRRQPHGAGCCNERRFL